MPRADLTVTVPEEAWVGHVSRAHPEARFRVLAAIPDAETGFGLVEISAPDPEAVLADLADAEAIVDHEVLHLRDGDALVQFETSRPMLLFPLRSAGVPLELPFDIVNGEAAWEVTASHERLSALGEALDVVGVDFQIERFRQDLERQSLLTDHQRDLVRAAVEAGYYDTPRETTLTELADELDMAKSSLSETLHRAEERIVKEFVAGLPAERSADAEEEGEGAPGWVAPDDAGPG